ncbi:hypothetical protein AYI70_g9231, partial [Smittium culicis]
MRPSDIETVDDSRAQINVSFVRFVVVMPKEKSTLVSNAGASYDDIISQGFWPSRGIFENYYQLSRMSQSNLTKL